MRCSILLAAITLVAGISFAAEPPKPESKVDTSRGDRMIAEYFRLETAKLRDACLADIKTLDDWKAKRDEYRRQLREMLGLDPLPERTPLKAETTGKVERDDFIVENVHFQSRPGLYVTGNLYLPKKIEGKLPTILYLCGHSEVKKNGVSYGNKTAYQHHGAWFARNGYACLVIDSLQLGEIQGIHHGTYKYDMWWWLNRGYTPAGVEAWNCLRALDYLETRPEVDKEKIGATGRSGGGAYTWWITALDDRIKCAVPVAGITDLQNYVVDGAVEGHCDCMFFSNTYQWDYPLVAALAAPRPLLITNTDRDTIFPLDGVVRTYVKTRRVYELYGAADKCGLALGPGPHKDTAELQVAAFRWFDVHLKQIERPIEPSKKYFEPEELQVFKHGLPKDEINTKIQETFVPVAPAPTLPKDKDDWAKMRDGWMKDLKEKTFRAWPKEECPLDVKETYAEVNDDGATKVYEYASQLGIALPLVVRTRVLKDTSERFASLCIVDYDYGERIKLDEQPWFEVHTLPLSDAKTSAAAADVLRKAHSLEVLVFPRGIGPTRWTQNAKKNVDIRRRYYLLGQTLEGQQIYDVCRAVQVARTLPEFKSRAIHLGEDETLTNGALALYASLFCEYVDYVNPLGLGGSHKNGPYLLNIDRVSPELAPVLAMAAERSKIVLILEPPEKNHWQYAKQVSEKLNWKEKQGLMIFQPQEEPPPIGPAK